MSTSPVALLRTRRLWPLVLAQACGALNDNLVKNAMVVLAIFRLGAGGAGLSALAGALFIAPYVLLSATAGQAADRFAKPRVILGAKLAELILMVGAAAAFLSASVPALLAVLLGLGIQAAVFGPVKYGILPELLADRELVAGNAVIEAGTFISIVAGTLLGGALVLLPDGPTLVGATGVFIALLGLLAAIRIPRLPAADPQLRIERNVLTATWKIVVQAASHRPIRFSILGLSWFWTIGATLMTEFPVLARDTMQADGSVLTVLLTVFALGVGVGSIGCAKLLKGEVSARFVPFSAFGISFFLWEFSNACRAGGQGGLHHAAAVASTVGGWRILADLVLLAACGGAFSVPLYAIMQDAADPARRSRTIAANNVVNALFMVAGAAAAAGLAAAGIDPPGVLTLAAAANLGVTVLILLMLPKPSLHPLPGRTPGQPRVPFPTPLLERDDSRRARRQSE